MATRRTKKPSFNIQNVLFAGIGGATAGTLTGILEKNVNYFQQNPKMTPAGLGALSAVGLMFMEEQYHPIFYGMLGASAGDLFDQFVQDKMSGPKSGLMLLDEEDLTSLMAPGMEPGVPMMADQDDIFAQLDLI